MDKISQEWLTLSCKRNRVLFYNTKRARLEGMAYSNVVERFFKILLYYLLGYRKNTGMLFQGIDNLLSKSLKVVDGNTEGYSQILPIMLQVQGTVLPRLMVNFKHQGHHLKIFAAQYIQQKLKELIDSAIAMQPEGQDFLSSSNETKSQGKESPFLAPPPPPPPSPDLMHSQERKSKKICENIKKEKELVNFLKHSALKNHEIYRQYEGAKLNLSVYVNKREENEKQLKNVSYDTVEKVLEDIEEQLQNVELAEITIMQDGIAHRYKRRVAQKTAGVLREILDTQKQLMVYQQQVDKFADKRIIHDDIDLSCHELENKLGQLSLRYKDLQNESKNLKFHQTLLFNYENQLRELKGKKKLKKKVAARVQNQSNTPKIDFKKLLGNIATACTKKAVEMKEEEPDLSRL